MPQDIMPLAMAWVIKTEGGYVNDPQDPGGETKYGISRRAHPGIDIKNLTVDEATELYRIDYWDAYRCGELPPAFGLFLFDSVVQHRSGDAVKLLQRAIGTTVDGNIGPKTIAATHAAGEYHLGLAFAERAEYYHDITSSNDNFERFITGWFRRLFELHAFIYEQSLHDEAPSREQLAAAFGKYTAGYRPRQEGWTRLDDDAYQWANGIAQEEMA